MKIISLIAKGGRTPAPVKMTRTRWYAFTGKSGAAKYETTAVDGSMVRGIGLTISLKNDAAAPQTVSVDCRFYLAETEQRTVYRVTPMVVVSASAEEGIDCYIPRRELEGIGSGRYQAEITLKAADGRIPEKRKAPVFIVV